MEIIILAGGMGTRLRAVVSDLPKPMAPVKNKPFLEYLFKWAAKYPVTRIVLSVGYKAEIIEQYFGGSFMNIPIKYVKEDRPLGTGGAIIYALNHISDENVLIINADTYFPIDLNAFIDFHIRCNSKLSIALKKMENFDRYGTVEIDGENIVNFVEKKFCEEGVINGGIYYINTAFVSSLKVPEIFSFEKEVLEKEAGSGHLKGLIFDVPFIDIGIPEDYYKAADIV